MICQVFLDIFFRYKIDDKIDSLEKIDDEIYRLKKVSKETKEKEWWT